MPTPIVITDVWEVALLWNRVAGVQPRNVLHFLSGAGTRAQLAAALSTNLSDNMFVPMSTSAALSQVQITALDGVTASTIHTVTTRNGSGTGTIMPAVAALVTLRTSKRGSRGRGRVYIGPVTEDYFADGKIPLANANGLTTAWQTFETAMAAAAGSFALGVASRKHLDFNQLQSVAGEEVCGTQRRRQTQLR